MRFTDDLQITSKKQAMPYPPLADVRAHQQILSQQEKARRTTAFQTRNRDGHLVDLPFVGLEKVITAPAHRSLAMKFGSECRREREMVGKVLVVDG